MQETKVLTYLRQEHLRLVLDYPLSAAKAFFWIDVRQIWQAARPATGPETALGPL